MDGAVVQVPQDMAVQNVRHFPDYRARTESLADYCMLAELMGRSKLLSYSSIIEIYVQKTVNKFILRLLDGSETERRSKLHVP